jgi:hypothetical protein
LARLYDEILGIAKEYMGIAAEDYIRRRIRIVQHGEAPETITAERIDRLVAGIDMTAKGYMSPAKVEAFRNAILELKGNGVARTP